MCYLSWAVSVCHHLPSGVPLAMNQYAAQVIVLPRCICRFSPLLLRTMLVRFRPFIILGLPLACRIPLRLGTIQIAITQRTLFLSHGIPTGLLSIVLLQSNILSLYVALPTTTQALIMSADTRLEDSSMDAVTSVCYLKDLGAILEQRPPGLHCTNVLMSHLDSRLPLILHH